MKTFIKIKIDYDAIGCRDSYLDLSSIICFRKNDCNGKTVVYTNKQSFCVNIRYEDFCEIMSKYFPSSFNN